MAQESSSVHRALKQVRAENLAVSVIQTGNTEILNLDVSETEKVNLHAVVATQAIGAFVIEGQIHPSAPWFGIASTGLNYTSPSGRVLAASVDMTTLAVGAAGGRVDLNTSGLTGLRVFASGGNATPSVVSIWANGGA